MRALVLLLALAVPGCLGGDAPADAAQPPPEPAPTTAQVPIAFSGMDHPYLCPPAGPVCVVSGPNPTKTYEVLLDNGTAPTGFSLAVDAANAVNDGRTFTVTVSCADNGPVSCGRGLARLDEAEGPLPLTLEASGLDLPRGVRILVSVTGTEAAPSVANTIQEYVGDGTLDVLRWA